MPRKQLNSCPAPESFQKWWRRRSNTNADHLKAEGKAMRASNYTVTEDQVNRQFKLLKKNFEPGEIIKKLQECKIPVVDGKPGENLITWSPKQFDLSKGRTLE